MANPNSMSRRYCFFTLLALWLAVVPLSAQPLCHVTYYDEEDGLPHGHATQLLQDQQGLMWFSTWNGLCRYDGYEFRTFKPQAGDGCQMATDRIRTFVERPDGNFICRVDEDYFLFDTRSYRFSNLPKADAEEAIKHYRASTSLKEDRPLEWTDAHRTRWTLHADGRLAYRSESGLSGDYPALNIKLKELSFACRDRQGNLWVLAGGSGIYKFTTDLQRTQRLPIEPQAQVKCLFKDSRQRLWVTTRDDEAVRLYDANSLAFLGYLRGDGRLQQQYTGFGAAVYCMYQSNDGTLWLGTKPRGIFRLKETAPGTFRTDHLTNLPNPNIYNMVEDRQGRLWVATLGGGLCYTRNPQADSPRFERPKGYPKDAAQRVRFLMLAAQSPSAQSPSAQGLSAQEPSPQEQVLLAATTEGLVVAKLEAQADQMHFRLHQREASRAQSLSSSATMDIMRAADGRLYVSTESGGMNRIEDDDLLKERLTFSHYSAGNHLLPTDVVLSMTPMPNRKSIIVSSHLVSITDSTGQYRQLDARYFNADYRFSDAHPLPLGGDRWIFGLNDGAFVTTVSQMESTAYQPQIVLTGVSIQGGEDIWAVTRTDTLTLQPQERSITVRFAAIDYQSSARIGYAFRLLKAGQRDTTQWNYIGSDHSVTLLDMEPGTYRLEIRSTNADGKWIGNQRVLTVMVRPTFWEAWYGRLLLVLMAAAIVATIVYTLLYIRRIKRQQHETLEKYLNLIEVQYRQPETGVVRTADEASGAQVSAAQASATQPTDTPTADAQTSAPEPQPTELDPMLQRVMRFVEENISNSEAGVGDMAAAAAVSRSGLQRKLKEAMGITPQDLLREARIKRACQLLCQADMNVSEVAYACGFSDPKYFSRSFKQRVGVSPTEYKAQC